MVRLGQWVLGGRPQSEVPFSSHRNRGPHHQHDHSQWVLAWVTRLRCACQVAPWYSCSLPPSHAVLFGRQSLWADHTSGVGTELHLLGGEVYTYIIRDSSRQETCLVSPSVIYLISYLFISIWTHEYVFYTLSCNPISHYFLCFLNFSSSGHWELFQGLLHPSDMSPSPCEQLLLAGATRCSRLIMYFPSIRHFS